MTIADSRQPTADSEYQHMVDVLATDNRRFFFICSS